MQSLECGKSEVKRLCRCGIGCERTNKEGSRFQTFIEPRTGAISQATLDAKFGVEPRCETPAEERVDDVNPDPIGVRARHSDIANPKEGLRGIRFVHEQEAFPLSKSRIWDSHCCARLRLPGGKFPGQQLLHLRSDKVTRGCEDDPT